MNEYDEMPHQRSPNASLSAGRPAQMRGSRKGSPKGVPAPVKFAFVVMVAVSVALVSLAHLNARPEVQETPIVAVPDATEALLATRLPMEVNERVERWIHRFLNEDRRTFEEYLVREGLYGSFIRERLRSRGMPEQLLYLAMIESGFSPMATSPVAASGVWQFMGATAQAYGLTVDYWVDERRDPIRATDAALDYLEELHESFGSWYLAAAAYNAGPARVRRALRAHGGGDRGDEAIYWQISEHLPAETRAYVPKILAASLLAEQPEHFGFDVERLLPYLFDRALVPGGTPLVDVARALEVEPALIRELNPHLIRGVTPPDGSHVVRVPQGDSHRLVASLSSVGGNASND